MDDIAIIENKIYEIRGQKVMLDFDLAEMYGVETKRLKEQVRRNIERFPAEFMFELTKEEVAISRSQIATLKTGQGYNIKYLPFAFTEYGIVMLSSVLKSKTAVEVNINIIRAFVRMRQYLLSNIPKKELEELKQRIEYLEEDITSDSYSFLFLMDRRLFPYFPLFFQQLTKYFVSCIIALPEDFFSFFQFGVTVPV